MIVYILALHLPPLVSCICLGWSNPNFLLDSVVISLMGWSLVLSVSLALLLAASVIHTLSATLPSIARRV